MMNILDTSLQREAASEREIDGVRRQQGSTSPPGGTRRGGRPRRGPWTRPAGTGPPVVVEMTEGSGDGAR